jgi:hypothetical protein
MADTPQCHPAPSSLLYPLSRNHGAGEKEGRRKDEYG